MARSSTQQPIAQLLALTLTLTLTLMLTAPSSRAMDASAMLDMAADIMRHCTKDAPLNKEEITSLCEMKAETENAKKYIYCSCVSSGLAGEDGLIQLSMLFMLADYKYGDEEQNKKVKNMMEGCSDKAKAIKDEKCRPAVFVECIGQCEFPSTKDSAKYGEFTKAAKLCFRQYPMDSGQLIPLMKQEVPLDEDQKGFLGCMEGQLNVLQRVEEIIAGRDEEDKQRIRAAVAKCRKSEPADAQPAARAGHLYSCFKEEGLTYGDMVPGA